MRYRWMNIVLLVILLLMTGCSASGAPAAAPMVEISPTMAAAATNTSLPKNTPTQTPAPIQPSSIPPTPTVTSQPASLPSPTPPVYGPESYPTNINPLTGLPVKDPSTLALPPALISISNFPVTARPQSGLSSAPIVYEMYVGYGMTRFLAVAYGDMTTSTGQPVVFGPIRSGRLPYEPLRMLLNGFLLIASGDEGVLKELKLFTNLWNPASLDVNGVAVDGKVIENIAKQYLPVVGQPDLKGLMFDPRPPQGGKSGVQLWLPFGGANMVIWRYDAASGGYLRFQDQYDGKTYSQVIDPQTKAAVNFENVVVLFAPHHAYQQEKIDISLAFVQQAPALLFRDGQMKEIFWSSQDIEAYQKTGKVGMMRFVDAQGQAVALKPGQTWVEVVTAGSPYFETANSMEYADLYNKKVPGSGAWGVQFWQPVPDK